MKKDSVEEKYRLLWAMDKVNAPFMYAVNLIRKKWGLPLFTAEFSTYEQAHHAYKIFMESLDEVSAEEYSHNYQKYNILVEALRRTNKINEYSIRGTLNDLPTIQYVNDIERLCDLFFFHKHWLFSLSFYIATNKIMVPKNSYLKDNIPPQPIVEQIKIFICDLDKKTNPNSSIKTDKDIGKLLYKIPVNPKDNDKKRTSFWEDIFSKRVKTYRSRYKKSRYFVLLPPDIKAALDSLFS